MASSQHVPSPGNPLTPGVPPMRAPHLEFVYRLVATLNPKVYEMHNVQGTGVSRSVVHIAGGTVEGPAIKGRVVEDSGADWAQALVARKEFFRLDARYSAITDDGHYIFIQAKGIFSPGPIANFKASPEDTYSQEEVEYFSHLTFEAGEGPYSWMNDIVAIGVMTQFEGKVVIDCWRLTNFPGKPVSAWPCR